jgi:hypothetical protein
MNKVKFNECGFMKLHTILKNQTGYNNTEKRPLLGKYLIHS